MFDVNQFINAHAICSRKIQIVTVGNDTEIVWLQQSQQVAADSAYPDKADRFPISASTNRHLQLIPWPLTAQMVDRKGALTGQYNVPEAKLSHRYGIGLNRIADFDSTVEEWFSKATDRTTCIKNYLKVGQCIKVSLSKAWHPPTTEDDFN